jgi:hypothetical protein
LEVEVMSILDFLIEESSSVSTDDYLYSYGNGEKLMMFQVLKVGARSVVIREVAAKGKTKTSSKVVPKRGSFISDQPQTAKMKGGKIIHPLTKKPLVKWKKKPLAPMKEERIEEGVGHPKKLEVVKGNKKLGAWTKDVYQVDKQEPFENGSRLSLTKLRGQASSKAKLVLFVRYAKHLDNDEFNASKGDGVNKVAFRVTKRAESVTENRRKGHGPVENAGALGSVHAPGVFGRDARGEREREAMIVENSLLNAASGKGNWTVQHDNSALKSTRYVGYFETEQEAIDYAKKEADSSRKFMTYTVIAGTPKKPSKATKNVFRGTK